MVATYSLTESIQALRATPSGKEAAMYGHIRDIFVGELGYSRSDVDIDIRLQDGRPDVTVRADTGLFDTNGKSVKKPWIVVEAKDEPGVFAAESTREKIFLEKSKYIEPTVAWFVMIDPQYVAIRRVDAGSTSSDKEISFEDDNPSALREALSALSVQYAGVSKALERFRAGDTSLIATEKLSTPIGEKTTERDEARIRRSRRHFFSNLRETTRHLQDACLRTLQGLLPAISAVQKERDAFAEKFGRGQPVRFDPKTLTLHGKPYGDVQATLHDQEAIRLRKKFNREPVIARLALESLPAFQDRTGADPKVLIELFAVETANLLLARILLLRFFEDHEFLGKQKYVCNGGVEAFQKMRSYFHASYASLLEFAYKEASRFYSAAFDETELDWVFDNDNTELSNAIEWALFNFARFDFRTAKGDFLTGIYDRFLDRKRRKKLGEFYTPPSIARFIIRNLKLSSNARILDPACGSGTFLIEAYREFVGENADRGAADFEDVVACLQNIRGNDINTFSALIAQMQIIWQVLSFKEEIALQGLPDIQVTARTNALRKADLYSSDRFSEIDRPYYDAVVGNPPYIRPERISQGLDEPSKQWYESGGKDTPGISPNLNSYALFLYRALRSWCKPLTEENGSVGKLGFIIPTAFFDSKDTSKLRELFSLKGLWTITEIIDLELIYRDVFDADTIPVILFCENRKPMADATVLIRSATKDCIIAGEEGALPTFDFDQLPVESTSYGDLWTPDGRIMTRAVQDRLAILRKLWRNPTVRDAAKTIWIKRGRTGVLEYTGEMPANPLMWEERKLIQGGMALRKGGKASQSNLRFDVYKGENILSTELQGDPILADVDLAVADDPSLWKYMDALPTTAYAIAQVAHCVNAVRFDPRSVTFTNTATIFVPAEKYESIPFDLIFMSNVYVYFYALAARMGILRTCRSHIYPTNFSLLPWSEEFLELSEDLEALRDELATACKNEAQSRSSLLSKISDLGFSTVKQYLGQNRASSIGYGEALTVSSDSVEVQEPAMKPSIYGYFHVTISDGPGEYLEVSDEELARGLVKALMLRVGDEIKRSDILTLTIPITDDECNLWEEVVLSFEPQVLSDARDQQLAKLDNLIGSALGLSAEDIQQVRIECKTDPFLSRVTPRYPGTSTRRLGRRRGLESPSRYE